MTPLNWRKRLRARPWDRRSSRTSPPSQRTTRTRPTPAPVHVFVAMAVVFFFLLRVAQLLIGPITLELCFLQVAFQRFVLGLHRMGSVELRPNAFSAVRSHSPLVFQFQLEPGLLRGRRVTRPRARSGASVFCWRHPRRAAGNASSHR